ncbi:lasso peptide biosynthesis B2 protein [Terriglobus sp. TAA 43]|uniref:lasso peptide biosynthesis B2 protein n=1 Tax=Terriglobus sp. TAA 43 TaxID=278961 RepID=UPI0018DBEA1A
MVHVLKAYCLLIRWDIFMKRHSFLELYEAIRSLPTSPRPASTTVSDSLYDAVEVACALYPKQVLCLQRSCVLTRMCRSRGLAAQLTIGSQRRPFRAHAWVTLEGEIIRDRLAQREAFLILEVC